MSNQSNLFERAQRVIPGGVNSPVRAFKYVGGLPVFAERAEGARVWDSDGHEYIDYLGGWGPHLLGHGHPAILEAIERQMRRGFAFGLATEAEVEMAEFLVEHLPHLETIRLTNSGTEATISAVRLARGFTKRDKIMQFRGDYHGHGDCFLVQAGSGAATFGVPDSAGVTAAIAADTLVANFNDLNDVERLFKVHRDAIAAIIMEPAMGNMGLIPPAEGFLARLRRLCDEAGTLLIFDEVMTGFRVAFGGMVERSGVRPDLVTYGKIIGGGMPVGAFGGRRDIMSLLAPLGPVYQGGTFAGHSLTVAAGLAALRWLVANDPYPMLEKRMRDLVNGLVNAALANGIKSYGTYLGAMGGFFFQEGPVVDGESAKRSDTCQFMKYHQTMLHEGVLLPPSQYESFFIGIAHDERIVTTTLERADRALANLAGPA